LGLFCNLRKKRRVLNTESSTHRLCLQSKLELQEVFDRTKLSRSTNILWLKFVVLLDDEAWLYFADIMTSAMFTSFFILMSNLIKLFWGRCTHLSIKLERLLLTTYLVYESGNITVETNSTLLGSGLSGK